MIYSFALTSWVDPNGCKHAHVTQDFIRSPCAQDYHWLTISPQEFVLNVDVNRLICPSPSPIRVFMLYEETDFSNPDGIVCESRTYTLKIRTCCLVRKVRIPKLWRKAKDAKIDPLVINTGGSDKGMWRKWVMLDPWSMVYSVGSWACLNTLSCKYELQNGYEYWTVASDLAWEYSYTFVMFPKALIHFQINSFLLDLSIYRAGTYRH